MPVGAVDLLIFHLASKGSAKSTSSAPSLFSAANSSSQSAGRGAFPAWVPRGEKFFPQANEGNFLEASIAQTRKMLSIVKKPASVIFSDLPAALGGYRVLRESGLCPGRNVLVTASHANRKPPCLTPNLTSIIAPPRTSVLEDALNQILAKKGPERRHWADRVLAVVRLFEGESSSATAPLPPLRSSSKAISL